MESKFKNKIQTAVSGTRHTVTTDKNKVIHRKFISNPLPFQQTTTTPAKKINTRQNTVDQPTCSKTLDNATTAEHPSSTAGKRHRRTSQTMKEARTGRIEKKYPETTRDNLLHQTKIRQT